MVEAFEAKIGNPARKLVLLKLADQANDNGLCWPSYATIASACEVDRRTVIRHIKQLEKDGFLRVEKTYNKDAGKNYSNRYHLTIANGVKKPLVSEDHHPSDKLSPPLVSEDHHPSVKLSPEPINEPISIEPIIESITNDVVISDVVVSIPPSFEDFWNLYNKKVGKTKCADKWEKISKSDKELIMKNLPDYLSSIQDKQYQKHPLTYLNNESWLDEVITRQPNQLAIKGNNHVTSSHTPQQSPATSNMQKLREQIAAEQAAKQFNNQHDQELRTVY